VLGIKDLPGPVDSGDGNTGGERDAGAADAGGGGMPDANDPAAVFLGTWQVSGGTQTLSNCTFAAHDGTEIVPTTVQIVWVRGTTTDIVGTYQGMNSTGCTIAADVHGNVATGVRGQTCTQFVQAETDVLTLGTYSFTIAGNTAHQLVTAKDVDQASGASCDLSGDSTYTRQ
jgi:hypothetical protein